MMTGKDVAEASRTWIGTPYVHQSRGPKGDEGGCDCVGLLIGVAQELGIMPNDYNPNGYGRTGDAPMLETEMAKWADLVIDTQIPMTTNDVKAILQEGDVMIFRPGGVIVHSAIVTKIDYGSGEEEQWGMVHAYSPMSKVVEHRIDDRWCRRMTQVWRFRWQS